MNIYNISADNKQIDFGFNTKSNYDLIVANPTNTNQVFGLLSDKKTIDIIEFSNGKMLVVNSFTIEENIINLKSFLFAGKTFIVAYNNVALMFYKICDNSLIKISEFSRTYGDSTTQDYSTIESFSYRGNLYMICYKSTSGDSQVYQLNATETQEISATLIWQKAWAPQWQHFAFFKMGGENFFLKFNTKNHKTNIDHVVDNPADGSHPVCSTLPYLENITDVKTIYSPENVGFVCYSQNDGAFQLSYFNSNCENWTKLMDTKLDVNFKGLCLLNNYKNLILY